MSAVCRAIVMAMCGLLGPALICLAAFVVLFALAGQTVNALFVYTAPK